MRTRRAWVGDDVDGVVALSAADGVIALNPANLNWSDLYLVTYFPLPHRGGSAGKGAKPMMDQICAGTERSFG